MASVPDMDTMLVEQVDSVRIRVTDRQKFGARLEIIRSTELDQSVSVMVEVMLMASSEVPDETLDKLPDE